MAEYSAGILLYRLRRGAAEVLLIHPGGPYWRSKDAGAWMIPKGGINPGETSAEAAAREFREELGMRAPAGPEPLCRIRQAGGKWVDVFSVEGDFDPQRIDSTHFEMEWPPRSGKIQSFPEADRAAWFTISAAREKMLASQQPLLDCLEARLAGLPMPPSWREVPDADARRSA